MVEETTNSAFSALNRKAVICKTRITIHVMRTGFRIYELTRARVNLND